MTQKDIRDRAARAAVETTAYGQPKQLGLTRLMELTPELIAHYGPLPVRAAADDCQAGF